MQQKRIHDGEVFVSFVWSQLARTVVEKAIEVYELSPEQANALRIAFIRRIPYTVEAT